MYILQIYMVILHLYNHLSTDIIKALKSSNIHHLKKYHVQSVFQEMPVYNFSRYSRWMFNKCEQLQTAGFTHDFKHSMNVEGQMLLFLSYSHLLNTYIECQKRAMLGFKYCVSQTPQVDQVPEVVPNSASFLAAYPLSTSHVSINELPGDGMKIYAQVLKSHLSDTQQSTNPTGFWLFPLSFQNFLHLKIDFPCGMKGCCLRNLSRDPRTSSLNPNPDLPRSNCFIF